MARLVRTRNYNSLLSRSSLEQVTLGAGESSSVSSSSSPIPSGYLLPLTATVAPRVTTQMQFTNWPVDSLANANWHGRRAYSGFTWIRRVTVLGGRYPGNLEILQGPSDLVVIPYLTDTVDGRLVFTESTYNLIRLNPTPGPFNVQVRYTDQDGNSITSPVSQCTTDTLGALFLSSVGSNINTGLTPSSPLLNDVGFHGGSSTNSTYAGYRVYLLGDGNIDWQGHSDLDSEPNYLMDGNQPDNIIGEAGSRPTLRKVNGRMRLNGAQYGWFQNFNMEMLNLTAEFTDRSFFTCTGGNAYSGQYSVWDSVRFTNFEDGPTTGTENGSCLTFLSQVENYRQNITVVNCEATGNVPSLHNTYSLQNSLFMGNKIYDSVYTNTDNSSTGQQMRFKRYTSQCSMVYCELWDNNDWNIAGGIGYNSVGDNIEIAYCKVRVQGVNGNTVRQSALRLSTGTEGTIGNSHIYRNSAKGDGIRPALRYDSPVTSNYATPDFLERNVLEGNANETIYSALVTKSDNIETNSLDTLLDSSMLQIGAANVDTHGATLSGTRR